MVVVGRGATSNTVVGVQTTTTPSIATGLEAFTMSGVTAVAAVITRVRSRTKSGLVGWLASEVLSREASRLFSRLGSGELGGGEGCQHAGVGGERRIAARLTPISVRTRASVAVQNLGADTTSALVTIMTAIITRMERGGKCGEIGRLQSGYGGGVGGGIRSGVFSRADGRI